MTILKPPRLRKGDVIGLIAPASTPSTEDMIEKGAAYLEQLGYRIKYGAHIRKSCGYLAGTDEERVADLNAMVSDNEVRAIFAIRGGYGTPRILRKVDYQALKQHPKIIVGYSDITALQLAIFRKIGLVTFSGPMTGTEMWKDFDPFTEEHFWRCVTSIKRIGVLNNPGDESMTMIQSGKAQGRLLGGNLSLLSCLMGTPYLPVLRHSILVLEDVDEAPHRIDRMLAQLHNAGVLRMLAGLIFGKFVDCNPGNPAEPHLTLGQIQKDFAEKINCPVIANFQYGHIPQKLTVPIGLRTVLDTKRKRIEVMESAVAP